MLIIVELHRWSLNKVEILSYSSIQTILCDFETSYLVVHNFTPKFTRLAAAKIILSLSLSTQYWWSAATQYDDGPFGSHTTSTHYYRRIIYIY